MLVLPNVRDEDNAPITGAMITATLYKKPGNTQLAENLDGSNALDHLELDEVLASPGDYSAEIPGTFNPPHGTRYSMVYEGNKGTDTIRIIQPAEVLPRAVN